MNSIHRGLITTDEDESDIDFVAKCVESSVIPPLKRKITPPNKSPKMKKLKTDDNIDSDSSIDVDLQNTTMPKKNSRMDYNKYIKSITDNPQLLDAAIIDCSDKMVETAFQNIKNQRNIELLEWSELVILQLCKLKKPTTFTTMIWKQIQQSVINEQWEIKIVHNIKKYVDKSKTLLEILEENHKFKIDMHKLNPLYTFVTRPVINYPVLKQYRLMPDVMTKPMHINRLPLNFKKIKV
ncbi:OrNV gp073-like protein [Tomelloso virus]|uniref:OrNV gp073-like protein n=1 Tax=Tomelloso virus TaxID=2053981 RepID=A0A2H4T2S9_9VIRU|nr:OrNV gp073-like protein [Tomelloso virus]ATY70234.1 OrNV gp073-like protein [Tomelloso virus]